MNSSNQKFASIDEWMCIELGSTWLLEIVYISTLVPLSIVAFVHLNSQNYSFFKFNLYKTFIKSIN